jgi:hypothetical protein
MAKCPLISCILFALLSLACDDPPPDPISPEKGPACDYHSDCDPHEACVLGDCRITRLCIDRENCESLEICKNKNCICPAGVQKCLPVCVTDNDCSTSGHCIDGICEPYPVEFSASKPQRQAPGNLQVGIARVELDVPVGVSMAGYAMRRGPSTPYRRSLGGSNGWFDKPDVRAIVFDDHEEMFILLRVPLSWSTDFMIADAAYKVQKQIGLNVLDHIVSSSPHSHSHPARFWHLVQDKYFGVFGYGEFSFEIFDRITNSLAEAIILALDDRQDAKFGYTLIENFDPEDRIYRDRRVENNELPNHIQKDDHLLVMRVDDMNGQPRAILANFGMHGTVYEERNPVLTGDAGGGVEVEMTRQAGLQYAQSVTGFYIQGNAGDASPSGGELGHPGPERIQLIGRRAWEVIGPAFESIETSAQIDVSIASQRVVITHEALGYQADAFFNLGGTCQDSVDHFRYGAFQCLEGEPAGDSDPSTRFEDGNLHCIFAIECLTAGFPVPQFQKTRLSVMQLGELAFVTVPGEPLSQYGRSLSKRIQETISSAQDAVVIGYSQDHHFYLLGEEDWWQGGYEGSRVIWGWRLGDYLADKSVQLAAELNQAPAERSIDDQNLKPMYWNVPEDERKTVAITDTEDTPNTIHLDLPPQIERLQIVEFIWSGGHPGVDRPLIILEKKSGGAFSPVIRPDGRIYDDSDFEMLVHYDGDCNRQNCENHRWRVNFEERKDFPLGHYRFKVSGRAQVNGEIENYTVRSNEFDLLASRSLRIETLSIAQDTLQGRIRYPEAVEFEEDGDGLNAVPNGHLLRTITGPGKFGAPLDDLALVTVTASISDLISTSTVVRVSTNIESLLESRRTVTGYDAQGMEKTRQLSNQANSKFSLPLQWLSDSTSDRFLLELKIVDPHGNYGTITATLSR